MEEAFALERFLALRKNVGPFGGWGLDCHPFLAGTGGVGTNTTPPLLSQAQNLLPQLDPLDHGCW